MDTRDHGVKQALEEQSRAAGDELERSLMRAVGSVEAELKRVVRNGEADLDRLARMIVDRLANLALDGVFGVVAGSMRPEAGAGDAGSMNQFAAIVARAARRGARFT